MTAAAHRIHDHHPDIEKPAQPIVAAPTKSPEPAMSIDALIRAYSLTGDDALLDRGWMRIAPTLENGTHSSQHHLQAAWLLQARHQFDSALQHVKKALLQQPRDAQAWLLAAAIYTVQGDAELARHACQQISLSVSPVATLACNARLAQTPASKQHALYQLLRLEHLELSPQLQPWVWSVMADLARDSGNEDTADRLYQQSIAAFPSVQVRAAYADLLIDQERYQILIDTIDHDEQTPALAVRRLLAAQALGQDIGEQRAHMDTLFRGWVTNGDFRHAREMALFYLTLGHDTPLAYRLAAENIKIQRETEDHALLLRARQAQLAERRKPV